ncbi:3-oxo-tetronate kinase [Variovorax ureilyticus]|uniref:3-oxo-tetronate kinase n=1 Tax=Variovorax ureilyticus TaxID=1836198 RepID=A0ABU8VPG9_9BURK
MTSKKPILGVIADDFTGATDVAGMLVHSGMRTVQVIGVPSGPAPAADAVVIALKSRTNPASEAVEESLAALRWLQEAGARQIYFKYCSTFDSTPAGNIGPVAEALMDALDTTFTVACPAFPENGRTICRGHLFVGDELLSDSGMRNHPLTPMTDSNLVRVLQSQCRGRVGLLRYDVLSKGVEATRERMKELQADGVRLAVADALDNEHLRTLAAACAELPLLTAGSGLALGLPQVYRERGWIAMHGEDTNLPKSSGYAAVLSGSCSTASNQQVKHWIQSGRPALPIDALALAEGRDEAGHAIAWAMSQLEKGSVLVYATAEPERVRTVQATLGAARAGELVERCLAQVARGLVDRGVERLVVAGGETSGAVVKALEVSRLRIGPLIDPGVPWTAVQDDSRSLLLALKSGNFGSTDFFTKALAQLP